MREQVKGLVGKMWQDVDLTFHAVSDTAAGGPLPKSEGGFVIMIGLISWP